MNKISCDVCMDLMPLVKDGFASEDSVTLVNTHINQCVACADAFGSEGQYDKDMDDKKVLSMIKKQMMFIAFLIMLVGALFGMVISDGINMFYNALIMPIIGALGYIVFEKKSYIVSGGLFIFCFIWVFIREIIGGILSYASIFELINMSLWWSVIFTFFSVIGIIIAQLLCYAFKKEVQK